MKVNLPAPMEDVQGGFPLLPPGDYKVRVLSCEQKEGQQGDYLNWTLGVVEGEWEGAKLFLITPILTQSLWKLKAFLQAAGISPTGTVLETNLVLNKVLVVTVIQEEYGGVTRNKVSAFKSLKAASVSPSSSTSNPPF